MSTLVNNSDNITFSTNQKNSITLNTENKFVDSNISLTTLVTKAILNKISGDTDHKIFNIQIPNGSASDLILTFTTDTNGNTVVTGTNAT